MSPISIVVSQAPPSDTSPARGGCPLVIRCGTAEEQSGIAEDVMRELVKINGSVRWYMETFLTAEPFRVPRAKRVAKSLSKYAERLIESLKLPLVVPDRDASQHLVIHIREADVTAGARNSINALRWEVLQDVKHWPEKERPATVSVVRVVDQLQPATSAAAEPDEKPPAKPGAALRILALTARPRSVGDLPHRLITKDIRDVVAKANAGGDGAQVEFDIVRPGLLESLEARLRSKGKGHYDVVHLDLHGVVSDNTLFAQFIQRDGSGAHNVAAETLAELLGSHGVQTVVLNACRSAFEDSGKEANLAKALIQQGINTAVAMAYNVTDIAAKLFFRVLYEQLLCHHASPFLAMQAARQCLLNDRIRKTKYRTQAAVDDYLVPSLYLHEPVVCEDELVRPGLDALKQEPAAAPRAEDLEDVDAEMVGREGNLLLLETSLLLDSCVVGIGGAPGSGKSAFAENAGSWWESTKLIDRFIKIDLSAPGAGSLAEVLNRELDLGLTTKAKAGKAKTNTETKIKKALRDSQQKRGRERLLILFDSVEAGGPHGISDADLELLGRFLLAFHKVQAADLGETLEDSGVAAGVYQNFVLVAARQLPQLTLLDGKNKLHTLQPLNRNHSLTLTTRLLEKAARLPDAGDWETLVLMEHFGKLAQGNPLAMRVLLAAFCAPGQKLSIPDFLELFFRGGGISLDSLPPELAAHRAVTDARRLLWPEAGQPSAAAAALSPFLAPFLPQTLVDHLRMLPSSPSRPRTLGALIRPFTEQGFLVLGRARDENESSKVTYLTPHPLLPLLLRSNPPSAHRHLLPQLFAARIQSWPVTKMYWDKAWDGPRESVRWEFYNLLSAIYAAAAAEPTQANLPRLNNLVYTTGKGLYWDRSRRPLMAQFWKRAAAEMAGRRAAARRRRDQGVMAIEVDMVQITFLMAVVTYYSDWDEARMREWLDETMRVFRGRARVGGFDVTGMVFGESLRMMEASRAPSGPAENLGPAQMRQKAAARKQVYGAFARMGLDVGGFDDEGAFGAVGGGSMVGRGNSMNGPDDNIRGAILLAKRKMERRAPEGPDVLGAREVLYTALEGDVFLGANPPTRASVHRALSEDVEEKAARYYEQKLRERKGEWRGTDKGKGKETDKGKRKEKETDKGKGKETSGTGGAETGEVDEDPANDELGMDGTDTNTAEARAEAVIEGHWRQALYHWEQALEIEEEAEFAKPDGGAESERLRTSLLERKAAGLPVLEQVEPNAKPRANGRASPVRADAAGGESSEQEGQQDQQDKRRGCCSCCAVM